MQEDRLQSVGDLPTRWSRLAGVLRYNRESDHQALDLTSIPPASQHLTEPPVKCEYCGEKPRPSLDLIWVEDPETVIPFCCAQHQQLCEMLVYQRCLVLARCNLGPGTPTPLDNNPTAELEELLFQGKGSWTVTHDTETQKGLKIKEEEAEVVPFCGHEAFQFGITHHQDGAGFLQKHYSNGMKFLTMFPDGSAQVFYPSGLLALVIVVTERKGRVCIVYDDSHAPDRPIRAVFQSDGRATCYHSNGTIWLSLDRSGGQCLDEAGARVRRWSWSSLSLTPTPLRPVFLSLNRMVGIRVLGQERVFVSFLASGQRAKFSVGACCVQVPVNHYRLASGPSISKEELFVSAGRIRVHLAIKRLHQCLQTPSSLRPVRDTLAPRLNVIIRRLLEVSDVVRMSERERAFIHRCLQDGL
ncbi:uncharacterized protein LOC139931550 [Centroberyx gerrardi]